MTRLRTVCLICCLVLILGVVGCGPRDEADSEREATGESTVVETESDATDTSSDEGDAAEVSSEYLTPADIEQVTGMSGIRLVPRDPSIGAGGTLNFATGDGELVVLLGVFTADEYEQVKEMEGWVAEPVDGIGDDAFLGPDESIPTTSYYLYFRSGDLGFGLGSFFDPSGATYLSMDQLKELAAIVLSRI